EDGIRDLIVTGVQTCALPISNEDTAGRDRQRSGNWDTSTVYTLVRPDLSTATTLTCSNANATNCADNVWNTILNSTTAQNTAARSEERRVGKECRSRAGRHA